MKVHEVLLLMAAAMVTASRATFRAYTPIPEIFSPECRGDPETDRWRNNCNWCSCRNGRQTCTRRACPQGLEVEGPRCQGDPSWREDCNRCACVDGRAVCTSAYCGELPDSQSTNFSVEKPRVCEEGSRWRVGCSWCICEEGQSRCTTSPCTDWNESKAVEEGIVECHGTSRWKKDCNWCQCVNGRGVCTTLACIPPERNPFHNLPEDAICVPGSRWKNDCNWCTCGETGVAACTLMACPPDYKDDGPNCEEGSVWKKDKCNNCRCINGTRACSNRVCQPEESAASTPSQLPQEPQCQGDPETDRWRQDCNWCRCLNGVGACTRRLCREGMRDESPECEGNPIWKKNCNSCSCINGTANCTANFCGETSAGPLPPQTSLRTGTPEPQCHGDPETDRWKQKCNWCRCLDGVGACTKRLCRKGEDDLPLCKGNPSWKRDCNVCHCNNGTAVCTTKFCGNPLATPETLSVQVTRVRSRKVECVDGSRWRVDCNWCSCHEGRAACTEKACLEPQAENEEPECVGDASWKKDCNWCTCGEGISLCTRMACLSQTKGPCTEGTSWREDCNICRCTQGFVVCTRAACVKRGKELECRGDSCGPAQLPDLCRLPPVIGNLQCAAFFLKWSFSVKDGFCKQIVYGGCGGTANLFDSEEECRAACPTPTRVPATTLDRSVSSGARSISAGEKRCTLPQETGPCFARLLRFSYNAQTGKCEEFIFGGCAGNANNFLTEEECLAACHRTQVPACDKSKCPWHLWEHYLAKQCVPQYAGHACCPTSFSCPSESGKDSTKCYYRGVAYNLRDSVPVENPCSASCTCAEPYEPGLPSVINCANVECPELFRPPSPGCRPLYRADSCCPYDHECTEPDAPPLESRSATCVWGNETFHDGDKMYFDDLPCRSCICGPGFTDPYGPGCSKLDCGLEFRFTAEYHKGCTPIHFEMNRCCPIGWMCPDDSRIDSQQKSQQQGSGDDSAVCSLGDRRLAVGEVLGLTECDIECRCMTPPDLTCIKYRSCELAQETIAQRACPPLDCGPGCHPLVSGPEQCPTCSCSPDTFTCPAQTCPSTCHSEMDLEVGCPSCKCKCPSEVPCPTGCPAHTLLDEDTGCPYCECKSDSPQARDSNVSCPVYPDGRVPCPQDCATIRRVDENGCELCVCDPNNTATPFGPHCPLHPPPPSEPGFCPGEGQAPCPMDCAVIKRVDENGCEVCECDQDDTDTPFGRPLHPDPPAPCRTLPDGRPHCPMDCAIIIYKDENGCEVCKCDPDNRGTPFGPYRPRLPQP